MLAFTAINKLSIASSSLSLPHPSPSCLGTVTELEGFRLSPESYGGLIDSLSNLTNINFLLQRSDKDIQNIALGLRKMGPSLTFLRLNSWSAEKRIVSDASMCSLCDAFRNGCTGLEEIHWDNVTISEEKLVELVETCRAKQTMRKSS